MSPCPLELPEIQIIPCFRRRWVDMFAGIAGLVARIINTYFTYCFIIVHSSCSINVDTIKSEVFTYVKSVVCRWIFRSYIIKTYYIHHRLDLAPPFLIFFCVSSSIPRLLLSKRRLISIRYRERTELRMMTWKSNTENDKKSNIFGTSKYRYTQMYHGENKLHFDIF